MSERLPEGRGWVINPAEHRLVEMGYESPDEVMTPFGKAVVFHMPMPDDPSLWICDLCNIQILTKWGDEPFPVAMLGNSHAFCNDCRLKMEEGQATDTMGEVMDELEGPWPFRICGCPGCRPTAMEWRPFIEPILNTMIQDIGAQN